MAAPTGGFGGNDWLVEDLYERYLDAPGSLSEAWRRYFEGNGETSPSDDGAMPSKATPPPPVATDTGGAAPPAPGRSPAPAEPSPSRPPR